MAEQELNLADVGTLFQQVDGKSVSQRMWRDRFPNLANPLGLPTLPPNRFRGDVAAGQVAGKEPVLGLLHSPPGTQDL